MYMYLNIIESIAVFDPEYSDYRWIELLNLLLWLSCDCLHCAKTVMTF